MNFSTKVLPAGLKDKVSCFTYVNSKVVDGGPEIALCTKSGFLHEVKNKKIIRSLNLGCKGTHLSCSYLLQNEKLILYYTVLTESHKLCITRRTKISLQVVETHEHVKQFEIYDFESLGMPQIRITFLGEEDSVVVWFPMQESSVRKGNKGIGHEGTNKANLLVNSLEGKLQILHQHIDELDEECNLLRKQLPAKDSASGFGMIPVGAVQFWTPLTNHAQPNVVVCDKWVKVLGSSLILGLKICTLNSETPLDVDFVLRHDGITDYTYRIFRSYDETSDHFFSSLDPPRSLFQPDRPLWLVGAFHVPEFSSQSVLTITSSVASPLLSKCCLREVLEVSAADIARQARTEVFTAEDMMGMRTAKWERRLRVQTEDMEAGAIQLIMEELAFKKLKNMKDELFYCTYGYLNEVLVALRQITEKPSVWKMVLLIREEAQAYLLVNALYDLLPENTLISVEID